MAALVIADDGDLELARHLLESLVRAEGTEPAVWRHIARVHIRRADTEAARRALLQLSDPGWTPAEAYLNLRVLFAEGDAEAIEAELAQQRARWPLSSLLLRAEAEYVGFVKGHPDDAFPLFELARTTAVSPHQRDIVQSRLYELEVNHLRTASGALEDVHEDDRHAPLVRRGQELLDTLRSPWAQSNVLRMMGRLQLELEDYEACLSGMRRSVELAPGHLDARIDYIFALMYRFATLGVGDAKHYLAGEAREHMRFVDRILAHGHVQLSAESRARLLYANLTAGNYQNDLRAVQSLAGAGLGEVDEATASELLQRTRTAEQTLFGTGDQ